MQLEFRPVASGQPLLGWGYCHIQETACHEENYPCDANSQFYLVEPASAKQTKPLLDNEPAAGKRRMNMLMTLAVILIVLWAVGLVSSYTMGGLIHILLVIALVVIVLQVVQGRRV